MKDKTLYKGIIDRIREKNFFEKILELMKNNSKICYLTCDGLFEGSLIRRAKEEYLDRIIDVGIAEQNLVGIAAGMALSGMIPLVATMSSFLTLRAYEQIHTDIAFNDLQVRLIGMNGGTSGGSGPTHDSICDFSILNAIPNIMVMAPADINYFWYGIKETIGIKAPIYFRMPRYEDDIIYKVQNEKFKVGGSNIVCYGDDLAILAVGRCVYYALQAAKKLREKGILVCVIDLYSIKPIDEETVISVAKETKRILTIEDHNTCGGVGTLVAELIARENIGCKLVKHGIPDEFAAFGTREEILHYYKMDVDGIVNIVETNFSF